MYYFVFLLTLYYIIFHYILLYHSILYYIQSYFIIEFDIILYIIYTQYTYRYRDIKCSYGRQSGCFKPPIPILGRFVFKLGLHETHKVFEQTQ